MLISHLQPALQPNNMFYCRHSGLLENSLARTLIINKRNTTYSVGANNFNPPKPETFVCDALL